MLHKVTANTVIISGSCERISRIIYLHEILNTFHGPLARVISHHTWKKNNLVFYGSIKSVRYKNGPIHRASR